MDQRLRHLIFCLHLALGAYGCDTLRGSETPPRILHIAIKEPPREVRAEILSVRPSSITLLPHNLGWEDWRTVMVLDTSNISEVYFLVDSLEPKSFNLIGVLFPKLRTKEKDPPPAKRYLFQSGVTGVWRLRLQARYQKEEPSALEAIK
jgi:hypothetical protein